MDDNESLVIEVTGINPNTSEDTLENYFGSSRHGGDSKCKIQSRKWTCTDNFC